MRIRSGLAALGAAIVVAACGGQDAPPPDKLDTLSWMDTMTFAPQVVSPIELGYAEEPEEVAPAAPRAASATPSAPRRTTTQSTARRTTSTTARAPAPAPQPQGRVVVERNTARDAAIGAAVGAAGGAVIAGSGNRAKGAIIGGVTGAVIGGVIGHTVDKKERVVYDYR